MAGESDNRVQIAASHWKPRFIANGIDVNDFEGVIASTADWKDWAPAWQRVGDMHRTRGDEAVRAGRTVTARTRTNARRGATTSASSPGSRRRSSTTGCTS
jgi:hypothetical protein